MRHAKTLCLTLAFGLALAGCTKRQEASNIPPAPLGGGEADYDGRGEGRRSLQEAFLAAVTSDHILFDTDKYNIDAQDKAILSSQANWLRANPAVRVVVEGHCDERGTRDYNLALGERRASAAANYLISLGIDSSRVSTFSYGKERPAALGSDEGAYAQNRRAVTVTVES